MKKAPFLIIILLTLIFSVQLKSQTQSDSNSKLKQQAIDAQKKLPPKQTNSATVAGPKSTPSRKVETIPNSFQLDENDPYQGRKAEFLSKLIVKELPADFPKYEKWMGVRHYNEILDEYYKNHLDILKDKVKNKFLNK